ncbi:fumarylacetoacetate hydrolase family protein [Deltaproteobacteria bacterium TL4]
MNSTERPHSPRIFCIGMNYAEHVRELSNTVPKTPVVFMKSATCLVAPGQSVHFPKHGHELHHEVELVVKLGKKGKAKTKAEALSFVKEITLGLDLTLRDVQRDLKQKGLPWEMAKSFEESAPMGEFIPYAPSLDLSNISFECKVNGVVKQRGNTGDMIFCVEELILALSEVWALNPGDLIYTGTPSGVGLLAVGDTITIENEQIGSFSWNIIA